MQPSQTLDLGFMPGEIVVAPHGRCCCVISSEPGVDSAMLKLDRQKRLKLVEARELPWRFTQAYAASNTALMLARIEGGSLHVARIDGRRKLVTATCQKLDDDSLSIAGGPSVNRLGFATTDGTTIFDFPKGTPIARVSHPVSQWRRHPSGEFAAVNVFTESEVASCLAFCSFAGKRLRWLTPSVKAYGWICSHEFSWDGDLLGLTIDCDRDAKTSLYRLPNFELAHLSVRRKSDAEAAQEVPTMSGLAFNPFHTTFFTSEPGGFVIERDYSSGRHVKEFVAHEGEVVCIQAWPTAEALVTTGADGLVKVWPFAESKASPRGVLQCNPTVAQSLRDYFQSHDETEAVDFNDSHSISPATWLPRRV